MHTTTRLFLEIPDPSDNESSWPAQSATTFNILDNAAMYKSGTISARPSASSVVAGTFYEATDLNQWYISDGTNWNQISQVAEGTTSAMPAAGVFGRHYYATDTGMWSVDNGTNWQTLIPSRGAANISTTESVTNTTFSTMPTPDQVSGIVLASNGLIAVWYQAIWDESVSGAAAAAIFLGSNQVEAGNSPSPQSTGTAGASVPQTLSTYSEGLVNGSAATGPQVTTGQIVGGGNGGGPCYIFATAGTYTVSVQFKASSGSVSAWSRKLWVQALSFA